MNTTKKDFSSIRGVVERGKTDFSKYFHAPNLDRTQRFNFVYNLFALNDGKVARELGIDKSTMSRYRRGIFEPSPKMKLLIAQTISKLGDFQVDSSILFGDDLLFFKFKEERLGGGK